MRASFLTLLLALNLSGTMAQAIPIDLAPGSQITIGGTEVRCQGTSSRDGAIGSPVCQQGETVCVGLAPGTPCKSSSYSKPGFCVASGFIPGGTRSCQCED